LRALRNHKRLTLSRLAAETGLSTALLSKLETDRMIPTLSTLATISRVYGVGMSHFFTEPEHHSLSITRKAHLESNARGSESPRSIPLNAPLEDSPLIAQMIELSAAATPSLEKSGSDTCSLVYVLEGTMRLEAGGMHELLDAGDCAYVKSQMPMAWSASGKNRCRVLVVRPSGEPK
jgi:transcriptional regulator with XRE-family HTH domain